MNQAIITAASNKFFPSLINLLGSIKQNYPNHPKIFVYDLGLFWTFRKELEQIENLEVLDMPHFSPFWRQCYTWKPYIISHPLADLNFYIDAGSQVLRPLDEIFEFIEKDDYFAVSQGTPLNAIVPMEYRRIFYISEKYFSQTCITAGVFGFKHNSRVTPILDELYDAAVCGLCLGLSPQEQFRNKGPHKSNFVRNCKMFRQDTTLLSLILRKHFGDYIIHDVHKYAGAFSDHGHPGQLIWNIRMNYLMLRYLKFDFLHQKNKFILILNRFFIYIFLYARIVRLFFKGKTSKITGLNNQGPTVV